MRARLWCIPALGVLVAALSGCVSSPHPIAVDVQAEAYTDVPRDMNYPRVELCDYSGAGSFVANRPEAQLLDTSGKVLAKKRLDQPAVLVGITCDSLVTFPGEYNDGSYVIRIRGKSAALDASDAYTLDDWNAVQGYDTSTKIWDVYPSDFH